MKVVSFARHQGSGGRRSSQASRLSPLRFPGKRLRGIISKPGDVGDTAEKVGCLLPTNSVYIERRSYIVRAPGCEGLNICLSVGNGVFGVCRWYSRKKKKVAPLHPLACSVGIVQKRKASFHVPKATMGRV